MATSRDPQTKVVISGEDRTKAAFEGVKRSIGDLTKNADALGLSLGRIGQVVGAAGGLGGLAVLAGGATIGGMLAVARSASEVASEVARLAALSNTTAEGFQRLAYGARSVGIDQAKLADIFKDVQDKVGDFIQTGGGGMADFFENIAPRVGVTAEQFRRLSGPEALQLYVSSLEKANVSHSDMVFYLEAIASDSSLLLPLLRDGGRGFKEMGDQAQRVGVVLSDQTIAASVQLRNNLMQLDGAVSGVAARMAGPLVEALAEVSTRFLKALESGQGLLGAMKTLASEDPVKVLRREIRGLQNDIGSLESGLGPSDASARGALLARKRAELARASIELQAALAAAGSAGYGRGSGQQTERPLADPPNRTKGKQSAADRYLEGLHRQLQVAKDLGVAEKLLEDIQAGRLGKISKAQEDELLGIALQIDAQKALQKAEDEKTKRLEEEARLREQVAALNERSIAALVSQTDAMAEANRAMAQEIEFIGLNAEQKAALERARIGNAISAKEEQLAMLQVAGASQAEIAALQQQIELLRERADLVAQRGVAERAKEQAQELEDSVKQLGLSFSSAFEEAVVGGRKLSDVMRGLYQDILRLTIRKAITEPLAASLSGGIGGLVSGLFGGERAGGGEVRPGRFYEVNERAPELLTMGRRTFLMMGAEGGKVVPPGRGGGSSSGGWKVEIINQGAPIRATRTEQTDDGRLRIFIEEAVASSIGRGGAVAAAMQSTYGLNRGAGVPRRG